MSVEPVITEKLDSKDIVPRTSVEPKISSKNKLELEREQVHDKSVEMTEFFKESIDHIKTIFSSQQGQTMFLDRLIETMMEQDNKRY